MTMASIDNFKQAYSMVRGRLGQLGLNVRMSKSAIMQRATIHSDELMNGNFKTSRKVTRYYNSDMFVAVRDALSDYYEHFKKTHGDNYDFDLTEAHISVEAEMLTKRWIILKALLDTIDTEKKVYLSLGGTDISSMISATQSPRALLDFFGSFKYA